MPAAQTPSNVLEWRLLIANGVLLLVGVMHSMSSGGDGRASPFVESLTTWTAVVLLLLQVALAIVSSRETAAEIAQVRRMMRHRKDTTDVEKKADESGIELAEVHESAEEGGNTPRSVGEDVVVTNVLPAPSSHSDTDSNTDSSLASSKQGGLRVERADDEVARRIELVKHKQAADQDTRELHGKEGAVDDDPPSAAVTSISGDRQEILGSDE